MTSSMPCDSLRRPFKRLLRESKARILAPLLRFVITFTVIELSPMDLLNPTPVVRAAAIEGQVDGRSPVDWGRFFIGRQHHVYASSEKQPWVQDLTSIRPTICKPR